MTPTVPVCRCGRCGGWLVRREPEPEEWPTIALSCLACGFDVELIAGALVAITRPATEATPWPQMRLPDLSQMQCRSRGRPRKVEAG